MTPTPSRVVRWCRSLAHTLLRITLRARKEGALATAHDAAAFVLRRGPVDPLKLQKLLYFGQAWLLAWTGEPLFRDTVHAWRHGPTVPAVWEEYRGHGSDPIPAAVRGDPGALTTRQRDLFSIVLEGYWAFAGTALSDLAHKDAAWQAARGDLPPTANSTNVIRLDAIRDHYATEATFGHPRRSGRARLKQYAVLAMKDAVVEQLDGGELYASVPGFPGVWATGATRDELFADLERALFEWTLIKMEDGDDDLPDLRELQLRAS